MTIKFKNDIWRKDARYPDAWRGERSIILHLFNTSVRMRYFPAHRENDWQRVDTATRINISPRWAKWFHVCSYYAGHSRNIYHLTVGHFGLSIVPGQAMPW